MYFVNMRKASLFAQENDDIVDLKVDLCSYFDHLPQRFLESHGAIVDCSDQGVAS